MAITGLNLPIDIPWERVCVTMDMLDPARDQPNETPPLWQSSLALFRYVPPDEYQIYPDRKIIYYKLTCTITNFQPRADQIIGLIDPGEFATSYMSNDELQRRLSTSLPCTAAVVHVSVSPAQQPRALSDYPYFLEVQPRQRALYEQVTETQERASRSLETLQVRKDAGTSNSLEVLDVDTGGGISIMGVGAQRSGERGAKTLGRQDSQLVTSNDASREARETLAFTTQLSQMYTLLQAYHVGTNRVVFYVTPRPHTVEPPTGVAGPRKLDGIQDFFLVVSQGKNDPMPCLTVRLDTGHLHIQPLFDYDRSVASQTLSVTASAPGPLKGDTASTETADGASAFYGCFFKSVQDQRTLPAPSGYVIDTTSDIESAAMGRAGLTNSSQLSIAPDRRQVTLTATATGYACHRNTGGDLANAALVGPLRHVGVNLWPDTWTSQPGMARRTINVSFRSEVPSKKIGEQFVLTLTMRQMHCCEKSQMWPPVIVSVLPIAPTVGLLTVAPNEPARRSPPPPPVPTPVTTPVTTSYATAPSAPAQTPTASMTMAQANDLQRLLGEETFRLSTKVRDMATAPTHDTQFLVDLLVAGAIENPVYRADLGQPAESLGLRADEVAKVAEALGRPGDKLTRADILALPESVLETLIERTGEQLTSLRLRAAGVRTKPDRSEPATHQTGVPTPGPTKPGEGGGKGRGGRHHGR